MIIIGLTGPTGAGKTTACETFAALGANIINADLCAREATQNSSPALGELAAEFGGDILENGRLDRKELARRAFCNAERTERLNAILFPYIKDIITEKMENLKASGCRVVVLDAPTLFESGCDALCDVKVAILSPKENRLPRILERDGISEADAQLRMGAGRDDEFYKSRADYILYNNSTTASLSNACRDLFNTVIKNLEGKKLEKA